jgi:hypothetical protein
MSSTNMTTANTKPVTLRDLVAAPVPLPVGNIVLQIQPLGWFKSVDAIDAIAPALQDMPEDNPDGATMARWIMWMTQHRESLLRFAQICSGAERADIEVLKPSHLAELLFGLMEINADFFVESLPALMHKLAPRVAGLMEKVAKALVEAAETASRGLSSASLPTATSTAN